MQHCLPLCLLLFPGSATAQPAVLSVVKSQENANQWTGITTRLQVAGVSYCVVDLPSVKSAADLGSTAVLFLPNVETLTPVQAIALEDWMGRGGRVIASGPVGELSQPGVRQLLRSLLGAYWGFSLSTPSNLEPLQSTTQEWLRQTGLSGTVKGGVMIPAGLTSQPAAVWQSQDTPPAVVTTDQATVLGWRWGTDTASSVELDGAWLRAVLSHYVQLSASATTNPSCPTRIAQGSNPPTTTTPATKPQPSATPEAHPAPTLVPSAKLSAVALRSVAVNSFPPISPSPGGHKAPPLLPISPSPGGRKAPPLLPISPSPIQQSKPIEQLTPPGLEVASNSPEPINNLQASALQQELENLIGRVESAQLTANTNSKGIEPTQTHEVTEIASISTDSLQKEVPDSVVKVVAQAREIAKALPQLIKQQNYTAARQQWLMATQLLWNHYPTDRNLTQPETRAMWLDRSSIVHAGSEHGLAKIFDQLAAAGINTVFFETFNSGYPIYPSQIAPQQNPLVRGWDPLASAVRLAHERRMELHAWVWTFAVGNRRHNMLVNLPVNYPGPLIAAHPNWASYDNRGKLFPPGQGKPFLDPANPEARRFLLSLFNEIVSRYQVDGLQLDYIRYPFQDPSADRTYGYGLAARQQFQQLTGVDPEKITPKHEPDLWQKWTEFRTQQIDNFVAEASQRLRQKRPNLILSVAVYPLSEHDRIYKLQQHWEVWARRGYVDLVVPMTYAPDTYRFQRLAQPWLTSAELGSSLILPGIRLLHLPLSVAVDQIQLVRDLPVSGYALFAVENLSNELQKIFRRTQGTSRSNPRAPIIPYRQPFQAAVARYAALQREWTFVLANQQLWLREPTLSAFRTQAKALEDALNQLAADPSPSRLAVAKAALTVFQSNFQDWMRLQALDDSYQVKVWSNRLAALEMLLRYGERVVLKREAPSVAEQR